MSKEKVKLAVLDMNNDFPNEGLRCITDIAAFFNKEVSYTVFNVRAKNELPDSSFDIYISSGGPGSPLEQGPWRAPYLNLMQELWDMNKEETGQKKHVFFICYSFQLMCDYFKLGEVKLRKSTSFGVLPVHKTKMGKKDALLEGLNDPYYAVDSRDWQLVQPKLNVFKNQGATILSLEKIRTHVELERAIMAVRFSAEFVGTQFHPEADPVGMRAYFDREENRKIVIDNFGEAKYKKMMKIMNDPDKLVMTYQVILPNFIGKAIREIKEPILL